MCDISLVISVYFSFKKFYKHNLTLFYTKPILFYKLKKPFLAPFYSDTRIWVYVRTADYHICHITIFYIECTYDLYYPRYTYHYYNIQKITSLIKILKIKILKTYLF